MDLDYSRHYQRWHSDTDEHFATQSKAAFEELKPYLPDDRQAQILEIGCGMGFALGGLIAAGYESVQGIDTSLEQIERAQRRGLPAQMLRVEHAPAFLDKNEGRFDLIYAIDVVEHIPVDVTIQTLTQFRKALKPGGLFVCRVPNAFSIAATRMRYVDWTHHVSFSEASLDFVLFNAGFRDIRIEPAPETKPRGVARVVRRGIRSVGRAVYRSMMALEIDPKEAFHHPVTPNIMGVARA